MNNLWRGIVCIKYRGALKRHARASGAQRAITLRSRNARKCARGSICLVREVSCFTRDTRYEEVIRKSDFLKTSCFNSKIIPLEKTLNDVPCYSWMTNEWKSFSLFWSVTSRVTCSRLVGLIRNFST